MLNFPIAFLNSNDGSTLLAFGEVERICLSNSPKLLEELNEFVEKNKGNYLFGAISYDVKNSVERLTSKNTDGIGFPDVFFWKPKYVIRQRNEQLEFVQGEKNHESTAFLETFLLNQEKVDFEQNKFNFKPRISKTEYLSSVNELKSHIQRGDIYEINFCQEFYAENVDISKPLDVYFKLNQITNAPFSAYFSFDEFSVFCGSPERFINKKGTKLISQPIKGTSKRGASEQEDEILKKALFNDQKERSENVMIVDLVRNDLSKIATKNSVKVDELFGVYSFKTVHQLISTISCETDPKLSFSSILGATFPMGSMTGAPKFSAMKLIEELESFKRGIYSGTIGFIEPNGDFDFNVVIRSLIYNSKKNYLSCCVGGAITNGSEAEKEYEECMVKIKGIMDGMNA